MPPSVLPRTPSVVHAGRDGLWGGLRDPTLGERAAVLHEVLRGGISQDTMER